MELPELPSEIWALIYERRDASYKEDHMDKFQYVLADVLGNEVMFWQLDFKYCFICGERFAAFSYKNRFCSLPCIARCCKKDAFAGDFVFKFKY